MTENKFDCCARQDGDGTWYTAGCYCGNSDDAAAAGVFVGIMNERARCTKIVAKTASDLAGRFHDRTATAVLLDVAKEIADGGS